MNLEDPRIIRRFWIGGIALLVLVCAADALVHHHAHFEHDGITIDTLPLFFPLFGFLSCVALVAFSKTLAVALKRKDTYYDDPPGD